MLPDQLRDVVPPALPKASKDPFTVIHVQNTNTGRLQGDPRKRCLSYHTWSFSMWGNRGFAPSFSKVIKLLCLFLRMYQPPWKVNLFKLHITGILSFLSRTLGHNSRDISREPQFLTINEGSNVD